MIKIKEGYKETEIGVLPEDWEVKELNSVCKINNESLSTKENPNAVINYIDIESVTTGRINNIKQMNFGESPSRARRKVQKEDILVSTVRPYLKAFTTVERTETNLICSTGFAVLSTNKDLCDYKYLYQVTISDLFINQLMTRMVGSNYPAVNSSDLASCYLPFPPLQEQLRISEILSTTDEHIEKLDKIIEDYQLLKKGMMKSLLTEGIGHTEFKETEIGSIPKEWEVKELGEVSYFKQGYQIPRKEQSAEPFDECIRYLYITDFFSEKNILYVRNSPEYYHVKENDICIANTGNTCGRSFRGAKGLLSNNMFKIFHNEDMILIDFYWQFLQSDYYWNQLARFLNSAGQPHVGHKNMSILKIAIPPIREQQQIVAILSELDNRIELYQQEREDFIQLKKALMEQLLTGEIRVNQ